MSDQSSLDRIDVIDVVNRMGILADAREWDALALCFADEVEVDYTSEFGGEVQKFTPQALMKDWAWLGNLTGTQHDISSHVVDLDGDRARCRAHVRAVHVSNGERGEGLWTCWGSYDQQLRRTPSGWKICRTQFSLLGWRGNPEINVIAKSGKPVLDGK